MKVRCSYCRIYVEKKFAVRRGIQAFCSDEHWREYVIEQNKKAAYKTRNQAKDLSSEEKLIILELDDFKCRYCETEYNLHVHHIKYRSEGGSNDKENLITLCVKHHGTVHSNKKRYQELCHIIATTRENPSKIYLTIPTVEKSRERKRS